MRNHTKLFNKIGDIAFSLFNQDIDILRSKYGRVEIDIPVSFIKTIKRKQLVNALLAVQFGEDPVIAYVAQCMEWDECKAFVEGT